MKQASILPRLLPVLAVATLALAPPLAAQQVGINSAVNTDATGTAPGAATRPLVIGQQVVHREHIVTDAGGQAQLLFLDESAMTIGPNSDVTIDEFVYDPATGKGRLAMNATRGVMRFVGGKLSKNEDAVSLKTPAATIGIRGGIFVLDQQRNGALDVVFVYGKGMKVTGASGAAQFVTRPGFGVSVAGVGAAPSLPTPAAEGRLAGILAQLSSKPGAHGGAKTPPSDASVAASGVSNTISGNVTASVQQANATTQPAGQPQAVNVGTIQSTTQVNQVTTQGSPAVQQSGPQFGDGFVIALKTNGNTEVQETFIGTLANGQLTVPAQGGAIDKGGTIPLPPGQASFGPIFTRPGDSTQSVGSTFLVPDQSAFTAVVSNVGAPFGTPNGDTTFIVGGLPSVNLPTAGVGSFSGIATGGVQNGSSIYQASGNFSATYNFASQQGTANFTNFDSRNFGGPIVGATGTNVYAGSLSGSNLTGVAVGKFFGNGAQSTGGLFAVTNQSGPTYTAAGVYAGGRQ
jgi:hypothetical protein